MNKNRINIVTISQVLEQRRLSAARVNDSIALLDNICGVELLKSPCRFRAFAIVINKAGNFSVNINLNQYKCDAESNILISLPDNFTQITVTNEFNGYILLITPEYLRKLNLGITQKCLKLLAEHKCATFSCPQSFVGQLEPYKQILFSTLTNNFSETENVIKGLIESYIFNVLGIIDRFSEMGVVCKSSQRKINTSVFENFLSLLTKNCRTERQVSFYAEKLCITPQYLSVIIKDFSGKSPITWIGEYVVAEAVSFLRAGFTIQQVSFKLNFPSPSAFSKFFKAQTGYSPKDYSI